MRSIRRLFGVLILDLIFTLVSLVFIGGDYRQEGDKWFQILSLTVIIRLFLLSPYILFFILSLTRPSKFTFKLELLGVLLSIGLILYYVITGLVNMEGVILKLASFILPFLLALLALRIADLKS